MVNREQLKEDLLNFNFLTQEEQKERQTKKSDILLINESKVEDPNQILPILIPVDSTSKKLWREWKAIEEHVSSLISNMSDF